MIASHVEWAPRVALDNHPQRQRFASLLGTLPNRRIETRAGKDFILASHVDTAGSAISPLNGLTADDPAAEYPPANSRPANWLVLLDGQLHRRAETAARLGLSSVDAATIYTAALARWGDAADQHLTGHYSAIAYNPATRTLRLARSPFSAPPLHYRRSEQGAIAASLLRCLSWQDDTRPRPDLVLVAQHMAADFTDTARGWYEGYRKVALGSAVRIDRDGEHPCWSYDLARAPRTVLDSPADYVAAARDLLDEAVREALDGARAPAALVTGGLDSAQVAASAAVQLGPDRVLHGFTYGPERVPEDWATPGYFADDRAAAAGMTALHPNLRLHVSANAGQDFRHRQRDLVQAMGCAPPSLGIAWPLHDLYEDARARGCDVMLTGDMGNETFSNSGEWAFTEYLLTGKWRQLLRALRRHHPDDRPLWRRFVALSLMPLLPDRAWRALHERRHGPLPDGVVLGGLSPAWAAANEDRGGDVGRNPVGLPIRSHAAFWRWIQAEDGQCLAELHQAFELLHGIPTRQPAAFRPLVEFCHGLPTDLFRRDGQDRWLAREMAKGRLPDAQRLNRDHGAHQVDWHMRLKRARPDLLEEVERMEDDPDIAALVDLPRLRRLLAEFPDSPADAAEPYLYVTTLVRAISAGRFIAFAKGRNDI